MKYPLLLYKFGRRNLSDKSIKDYHYMFMRNKPNHGWDVAEGVPDFTTIKPDQSFNWCRFSLPVWVRFDDKKMYRRNYAVVAIYMNSVRHSQGIDQRFPDYSHNIKHKALPANYSHCELVEKKLDKPTRRALRMTLRHRSQVCLLPEELPGLLMIIRYWLNMFVYKLFWIRGPCAVDGRKMMCEEMFSVKIE
jgi:hypothetical protein